MLVFHIVFGKTVPDISLNAVANLGYADCRFLQPICPGDTLNAVSDVGALRVRTVATKDRPCADFPYKTANEYDPAVILDLDYWVLMPR